MIDKLAWDLIQLSYAENSLDNMHTHKARYMEFCEIFSFKAFPVNQWQLVRYASFLSLVLKSHKSISNYCNTICVISELSGHGKVLKGLYYKKCIDGIRRKLRHIEKQAAPISFKMLHKILPHVNIQDDKQLVIWVTILFGFHLFLRKSNLIPDSRNKFDSFKQFQRRDFRAHEDVLIAHIKWAKNRQFADQKLLLPMAKNYKTEICPVDWFHYMCDRIRASPNDPAFCIRIKQKLVPITYNETQKQLRKWIQLIGHNASRYSMHSLRRGGALTAFKAGLPSKTIKLLGDWASKAYLRYIHVTLDTRMKAFCLFSLQDQQEDTYLQV